MNEEQNKLEAVRQGKAPWRLWGPYLSDRQWGTVREDYSEGGTAWDYFPHDHARSRAYRWGEDGLMGICDEKARLCFALALWNGNDPILKERLFGLTNSEGNHGEDVKEYYFYLDNTPTHSYMKALYKYPNRTFPYSDLVAENAKRKSNPYSFEYELLDTGIFAENEYTDVLTEYAKNTPTDILIRLTLTNRSARPNEIHVLPTLWFRNTWTWANGLPKPILRELDSPDPQAVLVEATHDSLGKMGLFCEHPREMLFVDNETNYERLYGGKNPSPYRKDGINDYVLTGAPTVSPIKRGTKSAAHYQLTLEPKEIRVIKLRLTADLALNSAFGGDFDKGFSDQIINADEFYRGINAPEMSAELQSIQRQAYAGLLWTKQFYNFVVEEWIQGDPAFPPPPASRKNGRNSKWTHFYAEDVLSMPDKWEYPWFADWDLCMHTIVWAMIDPDYAKGQLSLLVREWYMHPEGEVPAYEWSFSDANPPLPIWAAWRIYNIEKKMYGRRDLKFLAKIFNRCLLSFTWWINRKDADNNNLFQGGFLGLDNIGLFDRNQVPAGATIYQADASSWMGLFSLTMMKVALELAAADTKYDDMAATFFQHFVFIADALNHVPSLPEGYADLWDEQDGFFYDVIRSPCGDFQALKVRSFQGLMPIFAVETVSMDAIKREEGHDFRKRLDWFMSRHPKLMQQVSALTEKKSLKTSHHGRLLFSLVNKEKLRRLLGYLLDEKEFLSPHGIRAVSQYHRDHPAKVEIAGTPYTLVYAPAESITHGFGGNSNWRGPVWFPINFLLIESLQKYGFYYGEDFKVECPAGSRKFLTLWEVSQELSRRLIGLFVRQADGTRPIYGGTQAFQQDPYWRDLLLFNEYFHGDNGAGLGASHQTGWTGLVAKLIQQTTEYARKAPSQ
ncbi:MAG: glucosidase [Verrucomicrobia bacterium]|nr:glucosidase [Verrucomicrobiota bacterium]